MHNVIGKIFIPFVVCLIVSAVFTSQMESAITFTVGCALWAFWLILVPKPAPQKVDRRRYGKNSFDYNQYKD